MIDKRRFLAAAAVAGAGAAVRVRAAAPTRAAAGPGLLTVTGAIARGNRGALDAALDRLFIKHGVSFDRAWQFDPAMLARLEPVTIRPTLEYDARPHALSGPLLAAVVGAAGVAADAPVMLTLRAIDGYAVGLSLADARRYRTIVATAIDGKPLTLGGLGPLWAVHDADRIADFASLPLAQRFAACPWGLYAIDVKPM